MNRTHPQWPHLDDTPKIRSIVADIRTEMESYLRAGIRHIRAHDGAPEATPRWCTDPDLPWLLAAYAHRYGVIYWIPRHEATALETTVADEAAAIDAAGEYLAATGIGNTLLDYAVSCYVRSTRRRVHEVHRYVPTNGFQPTAVDELTVLATEFTDLDPEATVKGATEARYDLHDFAHLTAARLCPALYRCHLGPDLDGLPRELVDLVAGFTAAEQPPHADGVVFSEILTPLFAQSPWPHLPESAVVDWLTDQVVPYLLADEVEIPGGRHPTRPIHPLELAVLAQNKAYELPASEIEQHVFVRGGVDGHDKLAGLSSSERLRAIPTASRTWHEARNVLKHRAHRQAYRTVTSWYLRSQQWEPHLRELLVATLAHLDFDDYRTGARMNLFRLTGNVLAWGPDTPNRYREDG